MEARIIIAGGGYAGLYAAARLRQHRGMKVTLIDAKEQFIQRIRLHEQLAGKTVRPLSYRDLLQPSGIEFIQGRIESIEADHQTLTFFGEGGRRVLSYDFLFYALGSHTRRMPEIPGLDDHAATLDAGLRLDAMRHRIRQLPEHSPIVVMGAGLTGLETATELKEAYPHLDISLVDSGAAFQGYTAGAQKEIRQVLERLQIKLKEHKKVARIEADGIHFADGTHQASQVSIHCMGLENPPLARTAGIRTANNGQIQVDAYLRSLSHPNIFALGDAAELDPSTSAARRMACALACPMGTYAADALYRLQTRKNLLPFRFGFTARCISLGRSAALIQMVTPDDQPRTLYFKGKLAVWIKELICLGTIYVPQWELRWGLALNRWYEPKGSYVQKQGKSP